MFLYMLLMIQLASVHCEIHCKDQGYKKETLQGLRFVLSLLGDRETLNNFTVMENQNNLNTCKYILFGMFSRRAAR